MEISYLLLMLLMVPANVVGQPSRHVISQSSTELRTSFDHGNVKDLIWTLKTQQEDYRRIIKIQNCTVVENLNNRYKLSHHGNVLGINNLTKSDSGSYTAVVTMWDNSMKEEKFDLIVVDPVPTPKIEHEVERIGNQCYVTLKCSIPSNTDSFSYSWKNRNGDSKYRDINTTVNIIQNRTLDPQDTEFVCIVQNQADQKNVTAHIKYCSESNTTVIVIVVVVLVVALAVVAILAWWYKKRSSNPSEQENQKVEEGENYKNKNEENKDDHDEGQADEDENKMREPQNKDDQQKEDNLTRPVPETDRKKEEVEEEENYRNKNEENKDDQDEGQADEDENKVKEPKNKDEHQKEDHLMCPVPETGVQCREPAGQQIPPAEVCEIQMVSLNKRSRTSSTGYHKVWSIPVNKNEVKKHKEDEHQNKYEKREIQLQDTRKLKVWATITYENEVKKYMKDEQWNKEENRGIQLQETSYCHHRVRKDEVEEHEKKNDDENDEGRPLLEEIDAVRASKTRSMDRKQPYMMSSVSQTL